MEIKAVKFRKDGFYSQPFVFGGEEGMEKFDRNVRYRGSLQNYLIDTGDEVILVDTGLPAGTPEEKPDEKSPAYTGKDIRVLCVCVSKFEVAELRETVRELDPHAFFIVQEGVRIEGNFVRRIG